MKKRIVLLMICIVLMTGCNSNPSSINTASTKDREGSSTSTADSILPIKSDNTPSAESDVENKNHLDISIGASSDKVVEIREKMFIAQSNDIYFNAEDYLGKTIKYEGIFSVTKIPETSEIYYSVIRYGPGCCGVDANAGFEVVWDKEYPKQNDWVEAVGVLEEYEYDGIKYLRLSLTSLTVLPTRGAEYVSQ